MAKVKLGLDRLTREEKIALTITVKTAMTGNANFTTPNPPLATLGTDITAAQTKLAAYNSLVAQTQAALADLDATIATMCTHLTQEGAYVENASGGDPVKIETAGMSVRATAAPVGVSQVLNLVVTAGDDEGTLDAAWDADRGANSYEIHTSVDPVTPSSWAFKMIASKSSATLNGMTSGAKMWVRVRSIGANNTTGTWSDPATKTVP
jgi:hypothetical protein